MVVKVTFHTLFNQNGLIQHSLDLKQISHKFRATSKKFLCGIGTAVLVVSDWPEQVHNYTMAV